MSIQNNFPAIKPTLLLDFANTEALDSRVTFTRASTATYYGTETAKAEENLLVQSQTFETTWATQGITTTANTSTAPDGTTTADTITETVANSAHRTEQTVAASGTVTLSVFAKLGSGTRFLTIGVSRDATHASSATFDLSLGTNTQTRTDGGVYSSASATITSVAQGFYRCTLTVTTDTCNTARLGLNDTGTPTSGNRGFGASYTGDNTSSLILWGCQLEQRSAATNYTPTTTQPITNYIPVLESAASGVARFDHNPLTFDSLGLLIEESRANLILQSEDLDTSWAETRATLSLNGVVSPSGTLTADKLIASTDNDTHFTSQTFTGTAASHTFTVYAKANGLNHVALRLFNGTSQVGLAYYNLSTGATGTVTAGTAAITTVGNGFFRCSLTATLAASASCTADIQLANADNTNSFIGNAFDGVSLWGTQVELGSFATSYIPTVASQVTRAADAASMTGANFSSWFSNMQSTLYAEAQTFANTANPSCVAINTNAASTLGIAVFVDTSGTRWNLRVRGSADASVVVSYTGQAVNALNKAIIGYNQNSLSTSVTLNAASPTTATRGPVVADQLTIGSNTTTASNSWNGHIRKIAFYPLAVTSAQLQALTS